MHSRPIAIGIALLWVLSTPAVAAPGTCEANGTVVDHEGNPLGGVQIKFQPADHPGTSYDGKTNKKGRYVVPGMFNPSSEGMWIVEISAEGYVPIRMEIESRNVNRVLIGDVRTTTLKPGAPIPEVPIRPLGTARIDFTLVPADQVTQFQPTPEAAEQAPAAPVVPQRDPWDTALTRVNDGDLAGSIEFFEQALADEPDDPERHATLAKVQYQLEQYGPAEEHALRAIELNPSDVDVRMVLYSVYFAQGDLARAESTLVQARGAAPDDPRVLRQLAFVARESGNTRAAIEAYEALVELDPQDSQSWLALADLHADEGQMDRSEAAYAKVVELDPNEAPQVFFNLGALIMNKPDRADEDTRRAIGAFRKAIELKPDYLEAHKQLAFALLGTGDRAGAKTELEAYVQLAPDAPDSSQMKALIESLR